MAKIKLRPCRFCGKEVEIHTHPEWGNRGIEYGALIHHENCVNGMEIGLYSIHHQATEEEAYNMLAAAWNTGADENEVNNESTNPDTVSASGS